MKNRGFTLIELLGVIIILALLMIIVFPSIINSVKNSSNKTDDLTKELIYNAADLFIDNNINVFPKINGNKYIIELQTLVEEGLLTGPIKLSGSDVDITNNKCIQVTYQSGYQYDLKDSQECVEERKICKAASEQLYAESPLDEGYKYECEVKPGVKYNFYVLGQQDDGTINLIMDKNICEDGSVATELDSCQVDWDYSGSNNFGPRTAMPYLYNATKDWTNVPVLNYIYKDIEFQGISSGTSGYTSFISTNGIATITASIEISPTIVGSEIEPLRARMPIFSETKNVLSDGTYKYLYENLDGASWQVVDVQPPTNNTSNVYGYWTFSSMGGTTDSAQFVQSTGVVYNKTSNDTQYSVGVRPVINLKPINFQT